MERYMPDIAQIKSKAKERMKACFGVALLVLVLQSVLLCVAEIIPVVGAILIIGPLAVGIYWIFYAILDGQKPEFQDMFCGFQNFGETFLCGLLTSLFTVLWGLLFIIPGIVKSYSYAMAPYILMRDPDRSGSEVIKLSRRMMNGYKGQLFLLDLSFIGWWLLCCVTFGIALIYVGPYYQAARTEFLTRLYETDSNGVLGEPSEYYDDVPPSGGDVPPAKDMNASYVPQEIPAPVFESPAIPAPAEAPASAEAPAAPVGTVSLKKGGSDKVSLDK